MEESEETSLTEPMKGCQEEQMDEMRNKAVEESWHKFHKETQEGISK